MKIICTFKSQHSAVLQRFQLKASNTKSGLWTLGKYYLCFTDGKSITGSKTSTSLAWTLLSLLLFKLLTAPLPGYTAGRLLSLQLMANPSLTPVGLDQVPKLFLISYSSLGNLLSYGGSMLQTLLALKSYYLSALILQRQHFLSPQLRQHHTHQPQTRSQAAAKRGKKKAKPTDLPFLNTQPHSPSLISHMGPHFRNPGPQAGYALRLQNTLHTYRAIKISLINNTSARKC